jgi:hypothetical protein
LRIVETDAPAEPFEAFRAGRGVVCASYACIDNPNLHVHPISAPIHPASRNTETNPASLQAQFRTLANASEGPEPHPAQGTSTESSVGESRATTYSAGSASERFWSRWVSRGGT